MALDSLSDISLAALLVKVTAKIFSGGTPFFRRCKMRDIIVLVLPAPAPATIKSGPSMQRAASFCLSFKSFRYSTAIL